MSAGGMTLARPGTMQGEQVQEFLLVFHVKSPLFSLFIKSEGLGARPLQSPNPQLWSMSICRRSSVSATFR